MNSLGSGCIVGGGEDGTDVEGKAGGGGIDFCGVGTNGMINNKKHIK